MLYDVRFEDQGVLRPIAYRLSLSRSTSYGLGDTNWAWRGAFDVGEYNAGSLAQTLEVDRDVPENAKLLDAVFFGDTGPRRQPQRHPRLPGLRRPLRARRRHPLVAHRPEHLRPRHAPRPRTGGHLELLDRQLHLRLRLDLQARRQHRGRGAAHRHHPQPGHRRARSLGAQGHHRSARTMVAAPDHQHFLNFRLDLDVEARSTT